MGIIKEESCSCLSSCQASVGRGASPGDELVIIGFTTYWAGTLGSPHEPFKGHDTSPDIAKIHRGIRLVASTGTRLLNMIGWPSAAQGAHHSPMKDVAATEDDLFAVLKVLLADGTGLGHITSLLCPITHTRSCQVRPLSTSDLIQRKGR